MEGTSIDLKWIKENETKDVDEKSGATPPLPDPDALHADIAPGDDVRETDLPNPLEPWDDVRETSSEEDESYEAPANVGSDIPEK